MKTTTQIIASDGLVFPIKDQAVELDTSALFDLGIVHYENSVIGEWIERSPFEGREPVPPEARNIIDALITEATELLNASEEEDSTEDPNYVPMSVTRRQGKQQLAKIKILENVQPIIDSIPDEEDREAMQIYWDDAQNFERDSPELLSIAVALGLTSDQVDDMFREAAKL